MHHRPPLGIAAVPVLAESDLAIRQGPSFRMVPRPAELPGIQPEAELPRMVIQGLSGTWTEMVSPMPGGGEGYAVDSCHIMLAARSRPSCARVAPEACAKSCNSTHKEWYYGVKLHAFVARHDGRLPFSCALMVSLASLYDFPAVKPSMDSCRPFLDGDPYADKAYRDAGGGKEA